MKTLLAVLVLTLTFFARAEYLDSDPIGYYSEGILKNGIRLPDEGPGYMKLFLHRNRAWGTLEMITAIIKTAQEMDKQFPKSDRLQVGDISQEGGGDVSDLHSSHQNGLDVDLTYYRKNKIEQPQSHTNGFKELMVIGGRISANFDSARNWKFLKELHKNGQVQRIFVDPVIKKEICRYARSIKESAAFLEVLRSIRPYPNHQEHMHVRLRCPPDARECRTQEDTPAGSGCHL
jgi:penicillin-insensitive murein endopeptidase